MDILRVIAIIMVLFNHRYTYWGPEQNIAPGSLKIFLALGLSCICKCGPPLFFMVSGTLLLGREESFGRVLRHRVLRIIIVMLICSVYLSRYSLNARTILQNFLSEENWYFYSYIGYLLMLPFLRKIALHASEKDMYLYLILVTAFYTFSGIFTVFSIKQAFTGTVEMLYTSGWASSCWAVIFSISGFFLNSLAKKNADSITKDPLMWLLFLGSVVMVILNILLVVNSAAAGNGDFAEQLRQRAIYLPSCALYYFFSRKDYQGCFSRQRLNRFVTELSSASFGVFIIEVTLDTSGKLNDFLNRFMGEAIGLYWTACVSIVIEFVGYTAVILILKKISVVRKLL
ncbi:MAG: acyltransferase family protein [Eubacterium sp.]|nr:acyltransferase family protein [Eubacterium sp.]